MVLHAATAGATGASALKKLEMKNIPQSCSIGRLQELMSAACRSASDVKLSFAHSSSRRAPETLPLEQVEDTLSHNSVVTSLKHLFAGDANIHESVSWSQPMRASPSSTAVKQTMSTSLTGTMKGPVITDQT
jgi:hypothetical protein